MPAAFGLVHVMGGHKNGDVLRHQFVEQIPKCATRNGVYAGRWFVQKDDLWPVQNGRAEGQLLSPAAGQFTGEAGLAAQQPRHFQCQLYALCQ